METQFNWKTSRAAFSTLKKYIFLALGNDTPINKKGKRVPDELLQYGWPHNFESRVKHSELTSFCKKYGNIGRSAVSTHMQSFENAEIVNTGFEGKEKYYALNESPSNPFAEIFYWDNDRLLLFGASDSYETFINLEKYKQVTKRNV